MKKSATSLHAARLKKSWTREFVSKKVGVSLNTYIRWEAGQQVPSKDALQVLCEIFAMSSQELGFDELAQGKMDGELEQTIPKCSPLPQTPQPGINILKNGDLLAGWEESIKVCWKVYMQGGHEEIERQLPDYFRNLKSTAMFPGPLQAQASHILSEAHQLQALLKLHRGDFIAAQMSCTQAIIHSQLANNWNIYIASQLRMASILSYHKQPKASLQAYQEALRRINGVGDYVSPLLQSWTFAGIGTIYASLGSEKEAMQYLHLAMTTFPDEPEEDIAYPYIQADIDQLVLYGGQILLKLGEIELAWDIFLLVEELSPAISRRMRAEILYHKATIALVQRHMIQSCIYLEAAIKAALEIKSVFFLSENYSLYEHMLHCWGQEPRVRAIGKLFS